MQKSKGTVMFELFRNRKEEKNNNIKEENNVSSSTLSTSNNNDNDNAEELLVQLKGNIDNVKEEAQGMFSSLHSDKRDEENTEQDKEQEENALTHPSEVLNNSRSDDVDNQEDTILELKDELSEPVDTLTEESVEELPEEQLEMEENSEIELPEENSSLEETEENVEDNLHDNPQENLVEEKPVFNKESKVNNDGFELSLEENNFEELAEFDFNEDKDESENNNTSSDDYNDLLNSVHTVDFDEEENKEEPVVNLVEEKNDELTLVDESDEGDLPVTEEMPEENVGYLVLDEESNEISDSQENDSENSEELPIENDEEIRVVEPTAEGGELADDEVLTVDIKDPIEESVELSENKLIEEQSLEELFKDDNEEEFLHEDETNEEPEFEGTNDKEELEFMDNLPDSSASEINAEDDHDEFDSIEITEDSEQTLLPVVIEQANKDMVLNSDKQELYEEDDNFTSLIVMNGTPEDVREGMEVYIGAHPVYLIDITENGSGYNFIPDSAHRGYVQVPEVEAEYSPLDTFTMIKNNDEPTGRSFIVLAGADRAAEALSTRFKETPIGMDLIAEKVKAIIKDAQESNITIIIVGEKVNDSFASLMDKILKV